ncbi:conserved hypothetical protein [Theileria orientalis strain Shintoku]|uniref:Uncharacterized protein n=1 Tax=Theileria orientalis strain Shintoku TaxID=869250 RepID=J4C7Q0_THEOR|nr:conserved hypothetical protein [Theileria orientalis strain Shintoku]BAM39423.1 conserved hypothetical protein [Theileria orientalis strain Shintoku]|eukprot:XP_009689724.1 conserved hypothetical protein [Theileria orientalis strain Shintoku]
MDNEALFKELVGAFSGPIIVVRQFPHSVTRLKECAATSGTQMLKNAVAGNAKASAFSFADYDHISGLLSRDLEHNLLDSLRRNDELVSESIDYELGHYYADYSKWFKDWCVTLASSLRVKRHARYKIPIERNGVVIFAHQKDDLEQLERVIGEWADFKLSIVYLCEEYPEEFTTLMTHNTVEYCIVNTKEDVATSPQLLELVEKHVNACHDLLQWNVEALQSAVRNVKLTSKMLSSAEAERNLGNLSLLMCEELALGRDGAICSVIKSNLDHEILALAELLHGCYVYKYGAERAGEQSPALSQGDESDRSTGSSALSHFEKAIAHFNRHNCAYESFFMSVLSLVIGDSEELNKLLSKNALLELSSTADFARSALCLELSSIRCNKVKRKHFQLVMAGHLFNQATFKNLSKRCYLACIDEYEGWDVSKQHLYGLLGNFDPGFIVNSMNIISSAYENRYSNQYTYAQDRRSETSEASSDNGIGVVSADKEIYYLKKLMRLKSFQNKKHQMSTLISASFQNYPSIYYVHHELPKIEGLTPFLVRVPIIYLRKNGIIGTNVKIATSYVDDLYQKLLENSFRDATWQKCMKFYNIKDHVKRDFVSTDGDSKGANYMKNTKLHLTMQLLNPLNVALDCSNFKILMELVGSDGRADGVSSGKAVDEDVDQSEGEVDGKYRWVDCEILSHDKNEGFHMEPYEKKDLVLTFRTGEVGSFKVKGVCWKLFNCMYFWSPVYTVGRKLKNYEWCKRLTLEEFISQRAVDKALYFNVYEERPKLKHSFRKVSDLSHLKKSVFFAKKDLEYVSHDNHLMFYTEKYARSTSELGQPNSGKELNTDNLCLFEYFNGESGLIEILLQNLENQPINSVMLRFKVLGTFKIAPYPVSYKFNSAEHCDRLPGRKNANRPVKDSNSGVGHGHCGPEPASVELSWNVINFPNVKVREDNLTEKMYEVYMRFKDDGVTLHRHALSIYLFVEPIKFLDGIALIDGSVSLSPKSGLDLLLPFKLFLKVKAGPKFTGYFDYKDSVKIQVQNRSSEHIRGLDFAVNDKPVSVVTGVDGATNLGAAGEYELVDVPPRSTVTFAIPIENPIQILVDKHNTSEEKLKFTAFWCTAHRFGVHSGSVEYSRYKLCLSVASPQRERKFTPEPVVVTLTLTLQNVSTESIKSLSVSAIQDYEGEHVYTFIGVTKRNVSVIHPGKSVCLDFSVLMSLPGVYSFSPLDFKLVSPLDDRHVLYQDNVSTIILYD